MDGNGEGTEVQQEVSEEDRLLVEEIRASGIPADQIVGRAQRDARNEAAPGQATGGEEEPAKEAPDRLVNATEVEGMIERRERQAAVQRARDDHTAAARATIKEVVEGDKAFAGDVALLEDVTARVTRKLRSDPDTRKLTPEQFDKRLEEHTAASMKEMQGQAAKIAGTDAELESRLKAKGTGVTGSGSRVSGSGSDEVPTKVEPLGTLGRGDDFPDEAEIQRRHETREAKFLKEANA